MRAGARIQRDVPLGRAVPAGVTLSAAFCSQTGTSSGFCARRVAGSAADPRCVPCFAPSFPESTGGSAYTSLLLFTVQPQSSEDTQRQIAHTHTNTHSPAADCCCTTAMGAQQQRGLTTNTLTHSDCCVARPQHAEHPPNFLLFDEEWKHGS